MNIPKIPNFPAININDCFSFTPETDPKTSKGIRTDLHFLQSEYQRLDIIASALCTCAALRGDGDTETENRRLHQLVQQEDALFQWVAVDPEDPAQLLQAQKLLSSPMVLGIRIPASLRRRELSSYGDTLFAFAREQSAAVMVQPVFFPELAVLAEKYPEVTVIVPQLCIERLDKPCYAEHITKLPNVYTDTSGGPAALNNSLEHVVEVCGADRVLFGTCGESLAFEKARILLSALSLEDQQKILWRNAAKVFPKIATWLESRKEVLL